MKIEVNLKWGPHNQRENRGSEKFYITLNVCFSVQGRRRSSIQFSGEFVLRTLVWLLEVLGPFSVSINPSACPLLVNQNPQNKSSEGQKSQINSFKMG